MILLESEKNVSNNEFRPKCEVGGLSRYITKTVEGIRGRTKAVAGLSNLAPPHVGIQSYRSSKVN